jgi:hypothetical protein
MEQVEYVLLANPTVSVVTAEVVETARQNLLLGPDRSRSRKLSIGQGFGWAISKTFGFVAIVV